MTFEHLNKMEMKRKHLGCPVQNAGGDMPGADMMKQLGKKTASRARCNNPKRQAERLRQSKDTETSIEHTIAHSNGQDPTN